VLLLPTLLLLRWSKTRPSAPLVSLGRTRIPKDCRSPTSSKLVGSTLSKFTSGLAHSVSPTSGYPRPPQVTSILQETLTSPFPRPSWLLPCIHSFPYSLDWGLICLSVVSPSSLLSFKRAVPSLPNVFTHDLFYPCWLFPIMSFYRQLLLIFVLFFLTSSCMFPHTTTSPPPITSARFSTCFLLSFIYLLHQDLDPCIENKQTI